MNVRERKEVAAFDKGMDNREFATWERSRGRKSGDYRVWRHKVLARDEGQCALCGGTDLLEAHHLKIFAIHRRMRFLVSNGITLCRACHKAAHGNYQVKYGLTGELKHKASKAQRKWCMARDKAQALHEDMDAEFRSIVRE